MDGLKAINHAENRRVAKTKDATKEHKSQECEHSIRIIASVPFPPELDCSGDLFFLNVLIDARLILFSEGYARLVRSDSGVLDSQSHH